MSASVGRDGGAPAALARSPFILLDGRLTLPCGPVPTPHPVREAMAVGALVVVLLDAPVDAAHGDALFALTLGGEVAWRVPPLPFVEGRCGGLGFDRERGWIVARRWSGADYYIDPADGREVGCCWGTGRD